MRAKPSFTPLLKDLEVHPGRGKGYGTSLSTDLLEEARGGASPHHPMFDSDPASRSAPPPELPSRFHVGDWLIETELNRIGCGDRTVPLEPRIMQVLVCLARQPGKVATRDELLDEVWGDVTVQEEALTHAVSRLRRAFGDRARSAQYIETIPKRGYRLIAPVRMEPGQVGPGQVEPGQVEPGRAEPGRADPQGANRDREPEPRSLPPARDRRSRASAWIGVIAGVAVVLLAAFGLDHWRDAPLVRSEMLEGAPLTSLPGRETDPALSPDGTRVVFGWDGGEEGPPDLYLMQRGMDRPLRLTETDEVEHDPRWSPDGMWIAFLADHREGTGVLLVSALGGATRSVADAPPGSRFAGVDWFPDGETLAVSVRQKESGVWSLSRLTLATGEFESLEISPVAAPKDPEGVRGDHRPRVSPDGKRVVFLRTDTFGHSDLHLAATSGGEAQRLTTGSGAIRGFDWTANGRAIIFSSGTAFAGEFRLWRADIETGEVTWLPTRGRRSIQPTIARDCGALVYAEERYHCHIVRTPTSRAPRPGDDPAPFARSSHSEYGAVHSPSGAQVAFISTRSGHPEVWVSDEKGADARRVTFFEGASTEFIRWSDDERYIAFDVTSSSRSAVHVTDVERGVTRPLTRSTESPEDEILQSWSRNGEGIYLRSFDGEDWRTMRVSLETGEGETVLPFHAFMVFEEEDGESLLHVASGAPVLRRTTRGERAGEVVFEDPDALMPCFWKMADDGIFFYRREEDRYQLAFFDFATQEIRNILPLPQVRWHVLDAALDGNSLLFDQLDRIEADLVVVEAVP
jgi:Tol biopolymer transport system component/DNA-binding winged helix-turn-helix (wHTH) protein